MNIQDVIDGLLAGIDEPDTSVKEGSQTAPQTKPPTADLGEMDKIASFLDSIADQMEAAAKEASAEGLIPPDPAAVAEEIQGVTGIDRSEALRAQQSQAANPMQTGGAQKVAAEPEETRKSLPKPTPPQNPSIREACTSANKVLNGILQGKWPAPFVKRLAQ